MAAKREFDALALQAIVTEQESTFTDGRLINFFNRCADIYNDQNNLVGDDRLSGAFVYLKWREGHIKTAARSARRCKTTVNNNTDINIFGQLEKTLDSMFPDKNYEILKGRDPSGFNTYALSYMSNDETRKSPSMRERDFMWWIRGFAAHAGFTCEKKF